MSPAFQSLGIDRLSLADRIALVDDIWESVTRETENAPLTDAQSREVEARLAAHHANPQAAIPWEQVEAEALARLRR